MTENNCIVLKSYKEEVNGRIVHEVKSEGKDPEKVIYAGIRGGLAWTVGVVRPCYCIVGQVWDEKSRFEGHKEKGLLKFLCEYQSGSLMSLKDFFRKLTDDAKRYYCSTFYTDEDEAHQGDIDAFQNYINKEKITDPYLSLSDAPYKDDFLFGLQRVNAWREEGKINLPEDSLAHEQITNIEEKHLQNSPEAQFNAINALRYVVGSFFKSPPSGGLFYTPKRRHIRQRKF